jgi:hypothetical protein
MILADLCMNPVDSDSDNHLLGLAFDFTRAEPMPDPTNPDRTPFPPSPVLLLLVDEGNPSFWWWLGGLALFSLLLLIN